MSRNLAKHYIVIRRMYEAAEKGNQKEVLLLSREYRNLPSLNKGKKTEGIEYELDELRQSCVHSVCWDRMKDAALTDARERYKKLFPNQDKEVSEEEFIRQGYRH